jgi:hypothetical protein
MMNDLMAKALMVKALIFKMLAKSKAKVVS